MIVARQAALWVHYLNILVSEEVEAEEDLEAEEVEAGSRIRNRNVLQCCLKRYASMKDTTDSTGNGRKQAFRLSFIIVFRFAEVATPMIFKWARQLGESEQQ